MTLADAADHLRQTHGRPRLLLSRHSLLFNARQLRHHAGDGTRLCAVVKADAYGHGAVEIVHSLLHPPEEAHPAVDALALACLDEAERLHNHLGDVEMPVMILRPVESVYLGENRIQLESALQRGYLLSLISAAAVDDVARIAERLGVRAHVQVMLDTGMCREHCPPAAFTETVEAILRRPALRLVALGTHLTDSECPDEPATDEQLRLFHETVDPLWNLLPPGVVRHAANTGGAFFSPDESLEMIRCGIGLYGLDPTGTPSEERPLRPVARLEAPLLTIRDIAAGTTVGYGRTWRATGDTRIGLIPVGYADGYPRALADRAVVRVPHPDEPSRDAFCPVVGRVSMDYLTVDLGVAPWARPGENAILLDDDPASPCSAYALADLAGTIHYELLCRLGQRITRLTVE